jgi:thiamine-phosphate pyrophosphorylase
MISQLHNVLAVITDSSIKSPHSTIDQITMAIEGGVNMVHLRERNLPTSELYDFAKKIRKVTQGKALFFINERVDLALACQADGVQIGSKGFPLDVVRILVGSEILIGKSVHSVKEGLMAESEGADLILFGTIFPSRSHPDFDGVGIDEIQRICHLINIPVIAIGGIDQYNITDVIYSGVSGVAVISAIMGSDDPYKVSLKLSELINIE